MMDLVLLESLLAVADAGSITAAADRVSISQSALSRRLQQLESELGADLLVRGRHGVELTELGRQTVRHGRTILDRYALLRQDISEHLDLRQGTVRVGGGATATSFLLPEAIARFGRAHPGIHFYVKEAGSHEIAAAVAAGDLEIGVVTLPVRGPDVEVVDLVRDDIVLVGGRDHPLATRRVGMPDLQGQAFIAFEPGSAIRQIIDGRLQRAGIDIEVSMELRSIPSILRMVATTPSLAFVSRLGVPAEPAVTVIPVRGLSISRRLGLVTRRDFPLSPAAGRFTDVLGETVGALDANRPRR
jgi:LysR family transcriptional regulator, cyn operon transcriptional activator